MRPRLVPNLWCRIDSAPRDRPQYCPRPKRSPFLLKSVLVHWKKYEFKVHCASTRNRATAQKHRAAHYQALGCLPLEEATAAKIGTIAEKSPSLPKEAYGHDNT